MAKDGLDLPRIIFPKFSSPNLYLSPSDVDHSHFSGLQLKGFSASTGSRKRLTACVTDSKSCQGRPSLTAILSYT
jgi:hypothetical protein